MKQRGSSRGWLTRATKALEELTQKEGVTEIELANSLAEFHVRLNNVDDIQAQIEMDIDDSIVEENIEEAFLYRQKQCAVKNKAEHLLQKLREEKDIDYDRCSSNHSKNVHSSFGLARLPKLEMQTFSGNYLDFTSFYDKFSAIVDGSDLPAVTKFTYLHQRINCSSTLLY